MSTNHAPSYRALHENCSAIDAALRAGTPRSSIRMLVEPVRNICGASPFVKRLQNSQNGFPADFQTIEYVVDARPRCHASDPAFWIEWYALNSAPAQQHRNKLLWQSALIEDVANRHGRIASLACGGCAEFATNSHATSRAEFVLVDVDNSALKLAQERLRDANVQIIPKDPVHALRDILHQGPYDLVLCGCLFDYSPASFDCCDRSTDGRCASRGHLPSRT
jgi:extracellular factor (EF) 3-hydroxypalmitic acid methyl ester biosynthesis protein